jgi:hypothetical protein
LEPLDAAIASRESFYVIVGSSAAALISVLRC